MNKKTTMIFIVMLLSVSAAGLILWNHYGQRMQSGPAEVENDTAYTGVQAVSPCEDYAGIEKAQCYLREGNPDKSLEVCWALSEGMQYECAGRIGLEYAKSDPEKGIEICDKLPAGGDHQMVCFSGIASLMVAGDEVDADKVKKVCLRVSNPMICVVQVTRVLSYKNQSRALSLCENLTNNDSECYFTIVNKLLPGDPEGALVICDKVSDRTDMQICHHAVIRVIAGMDVKKAMDTCGSLPGPVDSCYRAVANGILKEDPYKALEVCGQIDSYVKDYCVNDVKVLSGVDVSTLNSTGVPG